MHHTDITSFDDLYTAIRNNNITFAEALAYIMDRESETWERGYEAAVSLYEPLAFPKN